VGGAWIAAGLYATRRPAAARIGLLMIATGVAWLLRLLTESGSPVLVTAGLVLASLYLAVAAHLLLAFPGGRIGGGAPRALLVAAYATAVGGQVVRLAFTPAADIGCGDCPEHALLLAADSTAADALLAAQATAGAAIAAGIMAVLARRFQAASEPRRRVLMPVLASGGVLLVLTGALLVLGAVRQETAKEVVSWAALVAFAAVPCAFLVGALRDRIRRGDAYRALAAALERPVGPRDLRRALAEALGDPGLQLAYALPGGTPRDVRYVDEAGAPVRLPGPREGRAWTAIARSGRPIAALVHDAALAEDAEHVRAIGATAALALENERLAAELRARIVELRQSRARIVEAAEQERRRIERDLHDGAQQRLAALALELGLAVERLDGAQPELRASIMNALDQADGALHELRALAHGIHPPLLTEQGLPAAVRALLDGIPLRTHYDGPELIELPAPVESALYFVVAEALANVLKHAGATRATVRLTAGRGRVEVEIADDGAGGATLGGGLRGLRDRIEALDGELELDSRPGAGTSLRARVPCAR
jgi:signal transduction histidine kinase